MRLASYFISSMLVIVYVLHAESVVSLPSERAEATRAAIEKSLPLLQATDLTFMDKSGCVSCHHNSLTAMTVSAAREFGIPVNESIARGQVKRTAEYLEMWTDRILRGSGIPGGADTVSYLLVGLGAEHYPPDSITAGMAYYLKEVQQLDGRWRIQASRPPIESSSMTVTATSMRALQLYAPMEDRAPYDAAVEAAVLWLRQASAKTTEERTFQLLGFAWGGALPQDIQNAARDLLAEQRMDGGWAQVPGMESDAYATGQALVALQEAASMSSSHDRIRAGIEFLLNAQLEDGTWHVKTRAFPIQPYFESGFPHGDDQWISVAASNWATKALVLSESDAIKR